MSIPTTLSDLVAELVSSNKKLRHNLPALTQRINQFEYYVSTEGTSNRPAPIVLQEAQMKDKVIDEAIILGSPVASRDQIWSALVAMTGAQFLARAEQLIAAAKDEVDRLRRVEAANKIQAIFLVAQAAKLAGAKDFRDPSFAQSTEPATIRVKKLWITEHNAGQAVTLAEVKVALP